MTLREVARKMRDGDFGSMPVGENDRLVGMITDRDIVTRALSNGPGNPKETEVREVMSEDVYYCYEDEKVGKVAESMGEKQIRRMPVLNREKRLVGIVSLGDLAVNRAKKFDDALCAISQRKQTHFKSASRQSEARPSHH
jgi:CBS domain-containing protein